MKNLALDRSSHLPIRSYAATMPGSLIREVAETGFGRADTIGLWFGESDLPTPSFICDAAIDALRSGQTFYNENRGIPPLRREIARYLSRLRGIALDEARVTVTSSGVSAIMVALQSLIDPGDNVVMVTPIWPNCADAVMLLNGEVRRASLATGPEGWRLDIDRVSEICDARTRAIFINSPNNPTGWMASRDELAALLDLTRRRSIWLIADEVYERLVYGADKSPSPLDLADADDLVISINSFSKAWCMTGWRLGWLVTPASLGPPLGKLIEINTSCAPPFVQHAGIAALRDGEAIVRETRRQYERNRALVVKALSAVPGLSLTTPSAAFYAFFRLEGTTDSLTIAKRLLTETGVGLAPGAAFGPEGEGWLRLCYAASTELLADALDKLTACLGR